VNWKQEWKPLAAILAIFAACYWLPVDWLPVDWLQASRRVENALWESLHLVRWYAREHVLLCLVPAFLSRQPSRPALSGLGSLDEAVVIFLPRCMTN
jgi:hypothetical protein